MTFHPGFSSNVHPSPLGETGCYSGREVRLTGNLGPGHKAPPVHTENAIRRERL